MLTSQLHDDPLVVFRDSRSTLTCIRWVDKHVAIMPRYSSSYWEVVVCHTVEEEETNSLLYFILFMVPPPPMAHTFKSLHVLLTPLKIWHNHHLHFLAKATFQVHVITMRMWSLPFAPGREWHVAWPFCPRMLLVCMMEMVFSSTPILWNGPLLNSLAFG